MKPGSKIYFILFFCFTLSNYFSGEEKIITSPLINVEEIKPSFEEIEDDEENIPLIMI